MLCYLLKIERCVDVLLSTGLHYVGMICYLLKIVLCGDGLISTEDSTVW